MGGRALVRRVETGNRMRGQEDISETSAEPAPVAEQAQNPPADLTRGPGQQPRGR